jgi:hypothetical protein
VELLQLSTLLFLALVLLSLMAPFLDRQECQSSNE